jgi:hypothetical protein
MTENLRDALRAGFAELTAAPAPAGLDTIALRRSRRQVTARIAGAAALVAAVTAGSVVAVGAVTQDRSAPPATGPGVALLSAASCVPGAYYKKPGEPDESYLLDRTTGRYVTVPYCGVVPAPNGRLAVVADGDPTKGRPERQGVMDLATRHVRWIPGHTGSVSWAPDSRHFALIPALSYSGVVVDAQALSSEPLEIPNRLGEPDTVLAWRQDGSMTRLRCRGCPPGHLSGPGTLLAGSHYGSPTHGVGVVNDARSLTSMPILSPDGTELAVARMERREKGMTFYAQILDARTGAYHGRVDLQPYTDLVGWYDRDHLLARVLPFPDKSVHYGVVLQVLDRRGHVLRTVERRPGRGPLQLGEMVTTTPVATVPDPHGVGF